MYSFSAKNGFIKHPEDEELVDIYIYHFNSLFRMRLPFTIVLGIARVTLFSPSLESLRA